MTVPRQVGSDSEDGTELRHEQRYFDAAWHHRERKRSTLRAAASMAANSGAAVRIRKETNNRAESLGPPDSSVAVGRFDDESGDTVYVGRHLIRDEDSEVLVVNWQAPAARRFYTASPTEPLGLIRKRAFKTEQNTILRFEDTLYAELAQAIGALDSGVLLEDSVDPMLVQELEKSRTGEISDIVQTIQAAQYDLISSSPDQVLVIQGGPGTGKSVVALHRVSWLLFNYSDRFTPNDVLVVGPNPTFTRYIRNLLPGLGDTDVHQRDIRQLAPNSARGSHEPAEVAVLKGQLRMAGLIARALDQRIGIPAGEATFDLQVGTRQVTLAANEVASAITRCRTTGGTYSERRRLMRDWLFDVATERSRADAQAVRQGQIDSLLDRLWPSLSAASFLRDLLGSRDRLIAAAGEQFTAGDVARLQRRSAERVSEEPWTYSDLPLLDEADSLINGVDKRFAHIVVDEAQDLSPMQLRSLARRSATGSFTIVGDIAQSTGHWARDSWEDLLAHLPDHLPHSVESLRYGYRVPKQVYVVADQLLPLAAPSVSAPQAVRSGPASPDFHHVELSSRASRVIEVATKQAAKGRFVGIICPESCRNAVVELLDAESIVWSDARAGQLGSSINLASPQEAKGLEFDAVVVVEPDDIAASEPRGLRLLYIALTRTTAYLDVVHSGSPLPLTNATDIVPPATTQDVGAESPVQSSLQKSRPAAGGDLSDQVTQLLAAELAAQVEAAAPTHLWRAVLQHAAQLLGVSDSDSGEAESDEPDA